MACFIGMKRSFLQGLLWLYLYGFGFMALSLEPGFLDFDNLPDTNFSCVGKVIGGYYADLETNCQMFHVCTIGQLDEPMDIRFLCLNGTVFDQETRVCERIDEVDCTKSEQFYSLNLELYGHSQSSNLEDIPETEQPLIIKSTPTTTTTTTTPPTRKTTRTPFYTSLAPPTATTPRTNHHHISTHHFPILNPSASDIRFNPEEINISLHPGAPPDIRTKGPISYYSDKKVTNSNTNSDKHLVVTTHSGVYTHEGIENSGTSTQKSHRYNSGTSSDLSGYGFTYRHEDSGEYTEPPESYRIRTEFKPSQEYAAELRSPPQRYKSSTYRSDYPPSTHKVNNNYQQKSSTTIRNYFVHSLKPPAPNQQNHYGEIRTEKSPQRLQLPLPLLPTLPALTFSSPAPFSLKQRIEQKRYTKDHIPPPRIVISASASVSDASGRKLNYSLGTIRSAQLSKPPPSTYDEYKDEDVALDPFYHDVPKIKGTRKKRSATEDSSKQQQERKINYSDIIRNDEEALNVLKFLFDWYKHDKTNPARFTTPLSTALDNEGISSINHGLAPETDSSNIEETEDDSLNFKFDNNDSFKTSNKYSTVGEDEGVSVNHNVERINNVEDKYTITHVPDNEKDSEIFQHEEDYVNDNYEPLTYREPERAYKDEQVKDNEGKEKYWSNKEESKNYSIQDDYIDNIEPIFYKERQYDHSVKKSSRNYIVPNYQKDQLKTKDYDDESNTHKSKQIHTQKETPSVKNESNFQNIFNINDHIHNKIVKTDNFAKKTNNSYSSQIENKEEKLITDHPEEERSTYQLSHERFTTLPTYEIQNTLTTERIISHLTNVRSNRRGNRKFTDNINKTEKEVDFHKPVVDKLIEKHYRAKDDYDFLRTIHIYTPTPRTSYQNLETEIFPSTTETEFIPTITETPIITTSPAKPVTLKTIVEVITTIKEDDETPDSLSYTLTTAPVTTTQKPLPKTRRGKFKFKDFSSEETIYIRKKPQAKSKETTDGHNENRDDDNKAQYLEHQDPLSKVHFIAKDSQENNSNQSREQQSNIDFIESDSQEPFSEILESTTNHYKRIRNEDNEGVTSSVAPTIILSTTEPSISTTPFDTDNHNASHKTATDNLPVQNSYIDIYATSFVPTTETIHITKKKQLKENLLDVQFDTTTENIAETTEEIPDITTWSTSELNNLIHKIESNTNSLVAPKTYNKLTSVATTESDDTTETILHTTTIPSSTENKTNTFNMSGMNLVSVSLEEKEKHFTIELDSTTEDIPITTDVLELNESIGFQYLDFKKEMNDFITKLDSLKFEHKNKFKEKNINSIEEDTLINDMEYTSESTTINLETTTNFYKNTQSTTTFEQTTIQPTTLEEISIDITQPTSIEETTTMRSRRRGGKPTRRRTKSYQPGYRHRFSTDSFTRRPQPRKQTIEEEIVDIYRRGKELTTENYRDNIDKKEYVLTDFPLRKSVNPTQAEKTLVTTPFSQQRPVPRRHFFFNCFGKKIDKFYPDLRDCRLFHYCTQGYSKNQLLDMKFVCDFNTFFDDEKLICTKTKPKRCL